MKLYSPRIIFDARFSSCIVFSELDRNEKLYRYVHGVSNTIEFYGKSKEFFNILQSLKESNLPVVLG